MYRIMPGIGLQGRVPRDMYDGMAGLLQERPNLHI